VTQIPRSRDHDELLTFEAISPRKVHLIALSNVCAVETPLIDYLYFGTKRASSLRNTPFQVGSSLLSAT
jgi:hypothetical protein